MIQNGRLSYPLPVRNYDILRDSNATVDSILIVVLNPQQHDEWVHHTEEELCMRYCAYWMSLDGAAPTSNTSTVTVHIPTSQVFEGGQLCTLMGAA
jgi:hypothetical protein